MKKEAEDYEEKGSEDKPDNEGVHISEEFQKEVHNLVSGATKAEIDYLQSCCSRRSSELYKEEKPSELSTVGMPD